MAVGGHFGFWLLTNSAAIFARVMGAKFFLNTSKSSNQVSNLTMVPVVTGPPDCTQLICCELILSLNNLIISFETHSILVTHKTTSVSAVVPISYGTRISAGTLMVHTLQGLTHMKAHNISFQLTYIWTFVVSFCCKTDDFNQSICYKWWNPVTWYSLTGY